LIGGQFSLYNIHENEICGAVISMRYNEDIIGIWNRNAHHSNHNNHNEIEKIRIALQKILQLPNNAYMEYKPHETSLQDRTTTTTGKNSATATIGTSGTTTSTNSNPNNNLSGPTQQSHTTTSSSLSGPSSRRSGSWTERDKTNVHNSHTTNINNNTSASTKPSARGSWRN
jgi:Eukaryotic initiation factor 4E